VLLHSLVFGYLVVVGIVELGDRLGLLLFGGVFERLFKRAAILGGVGCVAILRCTAMK